MAKRTEGLTDPAVRETLEGIAREDLEIPTLETRKSDAKDFHTVSVWGIKTALERAYLKGGDDERIRLRDELGV